MRNTKLFLGISVASVGTLVLIQKLRGSPKPSVGGEVDSVTVGPSDIEESGPGQSEPFDPARVHGEPTEAEAQRGEDEEVEVSDPPSDSQAEPPALLYLRDLVSELDEPVVFASLSNRVKHRFGEKACVGWFGFGKFKKLLSAASPDAVVVSEGSSYVLPAGMKLSEFVVPQHKGREVAPRVERIREADEGFPNLEASTWPVLYQSLAKATQTLKWKGAPTVQTVNACCSKARELTDRPADLHLGRKEFNYVAWMLYTRECLRMNMSALELQNAFVDGLIRRCKAAGFSAMDIDYAEAWVRGNPMSR